VPVPDAVRLWSEATEACTGAQTFSAEIRVSGSVGAERLRRVTLQGAMTRNGEIKLLAVAPAGPPIFNLAGRADRATLTLPRDRRILVAPAADIVDALIGLRLTPADWLDLLSGCVTAKRAVDGVLINGATIISLEDAGGRVRLEKDGASWRTVAGERPDLLVEYPEFLGRWPSVARLSSRGGAAVVVRLELAIGQVFVNSPLAPRVFAPDTATGLSPMTLDELRALGPMGGSHSGAEPPGER